MSLFRNRKKEEEREKAKILRDTYKLVFSSPEGKKVLEHIQKKGRYKESVFTQDPVNNAFEQGKQSLAIFITKMTEKE